MATIRRVDDIPIEGRFTFETHNGFKYEGPVEKKDLIMKYIIKTHKNAQKYPRRVYESLDEILISPVLFVPADVVSEIGRFIDTPRLNIFKNMTNSNLLPADQQRLQIASMSDKFKMYYEFGKNNDAESCIEMIRLELNKLCRVKMVNSKDFDLYAQNFIEGMLEGKHYHSLFKFIKEINQHPLRVRTPNGEYGVQNIEINDNNPHANACILILVAYEFIYMENYFTYYSDDELPYEYWEALFDFDIPDHDFAFCLLRAGFTLSTNMSDEVIDYLLTKRPTLAQELFSQVLSCWLTQEDDENTDDQKYQRYYRLMKKYSHLIDVGAIKAPLKVIRYGYDYNMFAPRYYSFDDILVKIADLLPSGGTLKNLASIKHDDHPES